MGPFGGSTLSRITLGSLQDLGYSVDFRESAPLSANQLSSSCRCSNSLAEDGQQLLNNSSYVTDSPSYAPDSPFPPTATPTSSPVSSTNYPTDSTASPTHSPTASSAADSDTGFQEVPPVMSSSGSDYVPPSDEDASMSVTASDPIPGAGWTPPPTDNEDAGQYPPANIGYVPNNRHRRQLRRRELNGTMAEYQQNGTMTEYQLNGTISEEGNPTNIGYVPPPVDQDEFDPPILPGTGYIPAEPEEDSDDEAVPPTNIGFNPPEKDSVDTVPPAIPGSGYVPPEPEDDSEKDEGDPVNVGYVAPNTIDSNEPPPILPGTGYVPPVEEDADDDTDDTDPTNIGYIPPEGEIDDTIPPEIPGTITSSADRRQQRRGLSEAGRAEAVAFGLSVLEENQMIIANNLLPDDDGTLWDVGGEVVSVMYKEDGVIYDVIVKASDFR
mgnify:CR=1 FL=1